MAFDLGAICLGIKTRLATVQVGPNTTDRLRAYDVIPASDLAVPAAVVQPSSIRYQEAFSGGLVEAQFRITLLTSDSSSRSGQNLLHDMLSAGTGMTSSVVAALETDKTFPTTLDDPLTATCDSSGIVTDFEIDLGRAVINEAAYWKADLMLRVLRARS